MFHYAQIAKPLNKLMSGENANRKNRDVEWLPRHQESFEQVRKLSSESPVLAYADYKRPFKVYTDASEKGLGAVLAQKQEDGSEPAIAFASRTLSKAEKQYDTHKLEFLTLKWAITDRFHEYLYGGEFQVYTDNNPLMYVLATAKLDAMGQQWVAALALYNFRIYFRSGKTNVNADALSRIPWDIEEMAQSCSYEPLTIKAITMKSIQIEMLEAEECLVSKAATFFAPDYMPNMLISEWQSSQQEDESIAKIIKLIDQERLMKYKLKREDGEEIHNYLKLRKYFVMVSGILHCTVQLKHQVRPVNQLVLPARY